MTSRSCYRIKRQSISNVRDVGEDLILLEVCFVYNSLFSSNYLLVSQEKKKKKKRADEADIFCDIIKTGLAVHMSQVHKEQLTAVENALPNRTGLDVEIFGMEGVPEDIIQGHNQRVITQFQQAEVERQAVTGNPPPGTASAGGQQPAKKPKMENAADIKKRLAAHKARKAEERAGGGSSGEATPNGAAGQQSLQSAGGYVSFFFFFFHPCSAPFFSVGW